MLLIWAELLNIPTGAGIPMQRGRVGTACSNVDLITTHNELPIGWRGSGRLDPPETVWQGPTRTSQCTGCGGAVVSISRFNSARSSSDFTLPSMPTVGGSPKQIYGWTSSNLVLFFRSQVTRSRWASTGAIFR